MNLRTLLGLGLAAAALAVPVPADATTTCVGQPDTGGVCVDWWWYGPAANWHYEETCVDPGAPPTQCVEYPVVDQVHLGQPPHAEAYCTGALDRTLNCPS